ncbi:hypothetical protein KQI65_15590 [bacterium]|nr:hypothetical protein [bacterium]
MTEQLHIVHRAEVDIHLTAAAEHVHEADIRAWCERVVLEEVDRAAHDLCPQDTYIRLPRLSLHLAFDNFPWTDEGRGRHQMYLREQVWQALRDALQSATPALSVEDYHFIVLREYLESGVVAAGQDTRQLHWIAGDILQRAAGEVQESMRLLQTLRPPAVFHRWIQLAGMSSIDTLLAAATGSTSQQWRDWTTRTVRLLERNVQRFYAIDRSTMLQRILVLLDAESQQPETLFQLLLATLYRGNAAIARSDDAASGDEVVIGELLSAIDQSWTIRFTIQSTQIDSDTAQPQEAEELHDRKDAPAAVHVANAGLVLLANFLPRLFENIGALNSEQTLLSTQRLPMLLHALATGETAADEWDLLLPKMLCGLQSEELCDTEITLSAIEKTEIDDLLHAVIQHWDRLKNVSVEGLRVAFLKREGKLYDEEGGLQLTVRPEGQDVLLSYLPWQYTYVRLPWMKRMLVVDW